MPNALRWIASHLLRGYYSSGTVSLTALSVFDAFAYTLPWHWEAGVSVDIKKLRILTYETGDHDDQIAVLTVCLTVPMLETRLSLGWFPPQRPPVDPAGPRVVG